MGSWCEVYLKDYRIDTAKSYIGPFYSCLFTEADKRSRMMPYDLYYTEPEDETGLVPNYEYAAPARALKRRLELLGYTLEAARRKFDEGLEEQISYYQELYANDPSMGRYARNFSLLRERGFDYWLSVLREIFDGGRYEYDLDSSRNREKDDIVSFLLDQSPEDFWLGYPDVEIGNALRAMLEAVAEDDELVLDITPLVSGGYYEEDEAVCEGTARAYVNSTVEFQKILILTEGKSDTDFLSRALKVLYPEVESYFYFLQFDAVRAEGGSSALERTIKAFAGAGIGNKIVGVFDNDAAGLAAVDRLSQLKLPGNIRVRALPDLELAKVYPTIGAQGETMANVNGRACSIELYFGEDILRGPTGLSPVLWKNMEERIRQYQGELRDKAELQKRFLDKLSAAERGGSPLDADWSGFRLIFEMIFRTVSYRAGYFHLFPG